MLISLFKGYHLILPYLHSFSYLSFPIFSSSYPSPFWALSSQSLTLSVSHPAFLSFVLKHLENRLLLFGRKIWTLLKFNLQVLNLPTRLCFSCYFSSFVFSVYLWVYPHLIVPWSLYLNSPLKHSIEPWSQGNFYFYFFVALWVFDYFMGLQ